MSLPALRGPVSAPSPPLENQSCVQLEDLDEALIKHEIGVDDGREMPDFDNIDWTIDRMDL